MTTVLIFSEQQTRIRPLSNAKLIDHNQHMSSLNNMEGMFYYEIY